MHNTRSSQYFRGIILLCACLLIFGNYFSYDLPGALTQAITKSIHDPFTGLEMQQASINLLYSVYNLPNIVLTILGGVFIDKLGLRLGCIIFVTIITAGQCVVAFGATFNSYWIMLIGRVFFSVGGEASSVAQNAFVSRWFKERELALALGLALSLGRLGSGLNFLTSASIADAFDSNGLAAAMWFGALFCGISQLACLVLVYLDKKAERLGIIGSADDVEAEKISFQAVKEFPLRYWLLAVVTLLSYSAIAPFDATAVSLLSSPETNYANPVTNEPLYTETTAGYIVSIPSFLAVFLAPIFGRLVDVVGKRPLIIIIANMLLAASHLLFAITYAYWPFMAEWTRLVLHPVVLIVVFGIGYGLLVAALFPCFTLIINNFAFLGTAFGIVFSFQNGGLTAIMYIMGAIQDQFGHVVVELCMAAFSTSALLVTVLVYVLDSREGGVLSRSAHTPTKKEHVMLEDENDEAMYPT